MSKSGTISASATLVLAVEDGNEGERWEQMRCQEKATEPHFLALHLWESYIDVESLVVIEPRHMASNIPAEVYL